MRYRRLRELFEIRKRSIEEYKQRLLIIISRYKTIREWRGTPGGRALFEYGISWYKPDAQAISLDVVTVWAWKPFWPWEKHKPSREYKEEVDPITAGFTPEEAEELRKEFKRIGKEWDGTIVGLPVQPAIDNIVRYIKGMIEKEYKVKITPMDMYEALTELGTKFIHPERGKLWPEKLVSVKPGEKWIYSPYFVYVEFTLLRAVLRLPNGAMIEDLWFEPFMIATVTQNIVIAKLLEIIAKRKRLEREIRMMIGEIGIVETEKGEKVFKTMDELLKEEFPELFGGEEKKEKKEEGKKLFLEMKNAIDKIRKAIGNFFTKWLGIKVLWVYPGPYDTLMSQRMARFHQIYTGTTYGQLLAFLKAKTNFPYGAAAWVSPKGEE